MAKIDKDTWENIKGTVVDLKALVMGDGISTFTETLKETITLQFEQLAAPLKNELISLINTALEPIMPFLTESINYLTSQIQMVVDYFTLGPGATAEEARADFMTWAIEYRLAHPFASPYEMMEAFLDYISDKYGTPRIDTHEGIDEFDDGGSVIY